jgi:3-hydroxyacyl-[acyl-carrier-protein] dehydratase
MKDNAMGDTIYIVPVDHPAFAGHFPGHPLLPGVALLAEALAAIEADEDAPRAPWTVESVKFLSPVGPGAHLVISRQARAAGGMRFEIHEGARQIALGVVSGTTP